MELTSHFLTSELVTLLGNQKADFHLLMMYRLSVKSSKHTGHRAMSNWSGGSWSVVTTSTVASSSSTSSFINTSSNHEKVNTCSII